MRAKPVCLLLVCLALLACTGHQRQDTLKVALTTTITARDGFAAWSVDHQANLVTKMLKEGASKDQVTTAIREFRDQRQPVRDMFEVVLLSISTAALADDQASLDQVAIELKKLLDAIARLKGGS